MTGSAAGGGADHRDWLVAADRPLAEIFDVALLDLDGVVYVGEEGVPGAREALAAASRMGLRLAFVTNNAARVPAVVADHLRRLGVPASDADVVTSAQAAAHVLADRLPAGAEVLVVGGAGLRVALRERGLVPVDRDGAGVAAVVQGFSPDVAWPLLAEGAYALARGLPWVASNGDRTLPTPRGAAPGNGALVQALAVATGRAPDVVAGKPDLPLHREAVERSGARRPLVVGDRLDTDVEGAVRAGTPSLLVLTGVTDAATLVLAEASRRPTYVAADLGGLLAPHPSPGREDGWWECGGWRVRAGTARFDVAGSGDPVDGLRALCAAAWSGGSVDPRAAREAVGRVGAARAGAVGLRS